MWVWVVIGLFIVGFPVVLSLMLDPFGIAVALATLTVLALVLLANAFVRQHWPRGVRRDAATDRRRRRFGASRR